jgi:phosphate transport system substrate-binding protein
MRINSWRFAAIALAAGTLVAGCGGGDSAGSGSGGSDEKLSGSIVIDGSSTVAPLSEAIAEEYQAEQPDVQVSVGTSGTGGGFKKFCSGETDISDASRPIRDEEKAECAKNGITYKEIRVGLDGLAVVTSPKNDFVECLDFDQLKAIWQTGGATTWDQVDPSFPKKKIAIFAPDTESGTYDFFGEEVLGDPKKPETVKARSDYTASSDDNVLVQGVEGEASSFGYFGFAYYTENKDQLKEIDIKHEGGCVAPSEETVESGEYPLSRPLFIYVKDAALERPEVKDFVRYYLETAPEVISDVGYVASPEADYKQGLTQIGA